MAYKPSDFFVGVIDAFAVLLPGAIATYLLTTQRCFNIMVNLPDVQPGVTRWLMFFVATYVLGHLTAAIGSATLDLYYDRHYAPARRVKRSILTPRADSQYVDPLYMQFMNWFKRQWFPFTNKAANFSDPLKVLADAIRAKEIEKLPLSSQSGLGSTLQWAWSAVRIRHPGAVFEVDRTMADSKFFRSLALIWLVVPFWYDCRAGALDQSRPRTVWLMCAALFILSVWRFSSLRWKATKRIYEYYALSASADKQGDA